MGRNNNYSTSSNRKATWKVITPGSLLHSKLDVRLADVATGSHARQEQGFRDRHRNRGSLQMWVTLGLARTPSMIALGCLDEGDERGEGQGLLLESTRL